MCDLMNYPYSIYLKAYTFQEGAVYIEFGQLQGFPMVKTLKILWAVRAPAGRLMCVAFGSLLIQK